MPPYVEKVKGTHDPGQGQIDHLKDGRPHLAATVSDFFIPQEKMLEHKIRLTQDEDEVQQIDIESRIVPDLIRRHTEWIEACGTRGECGIRNHRS
ncbi:hypothetical protein BGZ81_002589 [Podila clonocystis]|nr:hypothetical protein BGZ81_002589 [Podila clonocystis]